MRTFYRSSFLAAGLACMFFMSVAVAASPQHQGSARQAEPPTKCDNPAKCSIQRP